MTSENVFAHPLSCVQGVKEHQTQTLFLQFVENHKQNPDVIVSAKLPFPWQFVIVGSMRSQRQGQGSDVMSHSII